MAQQQSGDEEVGKEKPAGNGGAGTRKHGRTGHWRDEDIVLPVGPNNEKKIRQRHGVRDGGGATGKFIYFHCRRDRAGCKFTMRWTKQSGLLQQHGQHNHALLTPAKKVDWKDVDTLLPVGPINVQEMIKQRHGVVRNGELATVFFFRCRHYSAGCKFTMRWTKQDGLLQQHGRHNHAVTQNEEVGEQEEEDGTGTESGGEEEEEVSTEEEEDGTGTESGGEEEVPTVKREKDGTGTNTGGEEEEVRIVKFLQRDYKYLGRMVPEGEEKPGKDSWPVHTIEEEDEDMDFEEGTSQGTRKKKIYRYTQRKLPGPVKKEEPGAEEAEEAEEEAPPPPQMPRIAIVVPQWLLQPVEAAQPAKMLLRERKKRIDYAE